MVELMLFLMRAISLALIQPFPTRDDEFLNIVMQTSK